MEVLQDGGYLDRANGLISTVSTGTNSVLETVVAALVDTGGNKGTRSVQVLVLVMLVLLQVTTARLSLISWVNVLDSMSRLRTSSCSASSSLKSLSLSLIFSILFFSKRLVIQYVCIYRRVQYKLLGRLVLLNFEITKIMIFFQLFLERYVCVMRGSIFLSPTLCKYMILVLE